MKQAQAVAIALSAVIGLITPALAAEQNASTPVVVQDATGAVIGRLMTEDLMARRYVVNWKPRVVSISFSEQSLDNNFVFFYSTTDCTGKAYIETFFDHPVPARALYEEPTRTLWQGAPGDDLTLNANSAAYGSGACDPTVVAQIIASPAVVLDSTSHGFTPPFRAE